MQTISVKLKYENVDFFIKLLKKLNFVSEIEIIDNTNEQQKLNSLIRLPEGKPNIDDFAGLWSANPKTLTQIREKAWKRN